MLSSGVSVMGKLRSGVGGALAAMCLSMLGTWLPAAAHPHVHVRVKAQLIVKDGAVIGLRHAWLFDETWLGNQLLEHDKDGDGKLSEAELVPLTAQSKATLEMFRSFTLVRTGGSLVRATSPRDLVYTYHGPRLGLTFTVSLAKPVPLAGAELLLEIYDATFFSSFTLDGADAVAFEGDATEGCTVRTDVPASPQQMNAFRMIQRQLGPEFVYQGTPRSTAIACPPAPRIGEATLEAVGLSSKAGGAARR